MLVGKYLFADSLMSTIIQDGGKRERSNVSCSILILNKIEMKNKNKNKIK